MASRILEVAVKTSAWAGSNSWTYFRASRPSSTTKAAMPLASRTLTVLAICSSEASLANSLFASLTSVVIVSVTLSTPHHRLCVEGATFPEASPVTEVACCNPLEGDDEEPPDGHESRQQEEDGGRDNRGALLAAQVCVGSPGHQ
jgi:hypothetical protein